ncbi:MAG: hypothetical protein ACRCUS_02415 [Anaerovoracaceae bacterium]
MKEARIIKINIFTEKKKPGIEVKRVKLLEGKGIEGDFHADGGDRQISILSGEAKKEMKQQSELGNEGLCFKRYKENFLVENLDIEKLNIGDQILISKDSAIIEITAKKKCWLDDCKLIKENKYCPLKRGCLAAKVKKSGNVVCGFIRTVKQK